MDITKHSKLPVMIYADIQYFENKGVNMYVLYTAQLERQCRTHLRAACCINKTLQVHVYKITV
jgi:hypothetical protein